ncbi:MAG TPA: VCBS repeat-containing protein [Vicinamibacterales bacterium]
MPRLAVALAAWLLLQPAPGPVSPAGLTPIEIAQDWDVVYAVRVVDINADGRPDILAINPSQLAWFENPSWTKHVILDGATPRDNVTIAAADLDGDGRPEIALGAAWDPRNTTSGGTLHLAVRTTPDGRAPWRVRQIFEEPTLHRILWADLGVGGRPSLVVTPLHGRGTSPPEWNGPGARIVVLHPPDTLDGEWKQEVVDDTRHILHNFLALDFDGRPGAELITASREGLTLFTRRPDGTWSSRALVEVTPGPGEVVLGRVGGRRVFATVEPWHGTSIVTYTEEENGTWRRRVIDDTVTGGHALGWGDFDGDGHDELVAGWRAKPFALARYHFTPAGELARREILDEGVAVEDLAIADLDGDGRPDIVAGGRATQNIRVYLSGGSR